MSVYKSLGSYRPLKRKLSPIGIAMALPCAIALLVGENTLIPAKAKAPSK
jgi:hypothetical protein